MSVEVLANHNHQYSALTMENIDQEHMEKTLRLVGAREEYPGQ